MTVHTAGALSRQKGRASGAESRCLRTRVPMGGARSRERPFHAASSGPSSSPHQMPPPERQPPLTTVHTAGALSRQKGRASGAESRCLRTRVPMGGARSRERPFHAASSGPSSSPHQMPPPERQPPLTTVHTAGALSRQKGRASGQSRGVCAPACRLAAHAAERGPFTPPVAFLTPNHTKCRL